MLNSDFANGKERAVDTGAGVPVVATCVHASPAVSVPVVETPLTYTVLAVEDHQEIFRYYDHVLD